MNMIPWLAFLALVCAALALDLGVFHRRPHEVRLREALGWSAAWILLALLFNAAVYWLYAKGAFGLGTAPGAASSGRQAAVEFLTGYLVEKSLSLDNIFVIAMIFHYFRVPAQYRHRLLFYGVLGAILMRAVMIAAGAVLIRRFAWMSYVFGGILLLTAVKMLKSGEPGLDLEHNPIVRLARRLWPVSHRYDGGRFFTRMDGRLALTPMFLALIVVETSDLLFAVDSIPAIFAVTQDIFLVFTSNIFAILGLRALYFAVEGLLGMFRYLRPTLVLILAYVGVKMLLAHHYPIPAGVSLGVIFGLLAGGIAASVLKGERRQA